MIYKRIKGTRDILPEEHKVRDKIYAVARELFETFAYLPVLTPAFEQTDLFIRGIGEASDIVQKEMYTFNDRSGRSLTLRPEGTAPVVRAYIENNLKDYRFPGKFYYIMPMWRYERPQKGRLREFWQIGIEVFGAKGPDVDAEVIFLMLEYFRRLGLKRYETRINTIGCKNCRPEYIEVLREYLYQIKENLCEDCQIRMEKNPLRVFDCKAKGCQPFIQKAPVIRGHLCDECREHFKGLKNYLDMMGIEYVVDDRLVRGFDYYEKTTFEVVSPLLGAQSAVGGGGRYDRLIADAGGEDTPGLGFAIGVERLLLQLEEENVLPAASTEIDVFVVSYKGFEKKAFDIAHNLRLDGIKAEFDYLARSMKAQFKQADRLRAAYVLILAPDEDAAGSLKVRNMVSGEEEVIPYDNILEYLKSKISTGSE